ncbi:MAG: type II toxin-antitoxin system HipA family toxin [Thiotrichales bacterium]|jgi:serine/threonine-protein kinase HipA|nr:type II toxin-antitoxin system HipA family toxin [Thiotrichales bacterium]
MNDKLSVWVAHQEVGVLCREQNEIVFRYTTEDETRFVSLTMPVRAKSYALSYLMPIFEMHLPEGYLLSVIKKHFSKLTTTDDFGLLSILAPSISGRVHYLSERVQKDEPLTLERLLHNQSVNLFQSLVARFALSSPLSGVQPKVLANIQDKATLKYEDVIVKSWGDDYPELALNEYLCMTALKLADIPVPEFYLSDDERLFVMKRFDVCENGADWLGFEDMCVLQAKRKDDKYTGSYEQLAKSIKTFVSAHYKQTSLIQFFKMMVMNHLLQNGDAHLKNFGVVYEDRQQVRLAPAYDVVCTSYYVPQDMTALTMQGTKRWQSKQGLIKFGIDACELTSKQANTHYNECTAALLQLGNIIANRLVTETVTEKRALLEKLKQLIAAVDSR